MELNIVAIPTNTHKKFNKKKSLFNNKRKVQTRPNDFSFTFNKTDKVSATVAGIKKLGHVIKTNKKSLITNEILNNEDIKPSNKLSNIQHIKSNKKKINKYLPSIENVYNKKNQETLLDENQEKVFSKIPKSIVSNPPKTELIVNSTSNETDLQKRFKGQSDYKDNKGKFSSQQSKISSLFGNNPEVPTVGQRLIKPITENVFCGKQISSLPIHPHSIKNIKDLLDITELTTVQEKTIPVLLNGRDALIRSQTGSGKTLSYSLPIVESLHSIRPKVTRNQGVLALIIVPTRELAIQTYELFVKLVKPFTWIVPGYLIGGEKRKSEKARLRKGINILIGTPGRLCDHLLHSSHLKLDSVKWLILDEADRLLELGYERDVKEIVQSLSNQKSTSWYDPLALLKQATENNAKNNNAKSVHKEYENISGNDDEMQEIVIDSKMSETLKVSHDLQNIENEESSSSESKEEETMSSSESDNSSDNQKEDNYSKNKQTKLKKYKGITMFQGIQAVFSDNNSANVNNNETLVKKPNISKVSTEETLAKSKNSLQTVLLSATLTPAVETLAGLALQDPIFIETSEDKTFDDATSVKTTSNEEIMSIPASVAQSYVIVPPKLRLVTLSGIIMNECLRTQNSKILVFVATQDLVDYHSNLMQRVLSKKNSVIDSDGDSDNELDVSNVITFFKLHGSMGQQDRNRVIKEFRIAKSGVLFCTDVAARGLDIPTVSLVVQYTPPLSVADYAHRVGRTARGGRSGRAIILLSPHEADYVRILEDRRIRLSQENLESSLEALLTPQYSNAQESAAAIQQKYEEIILDDKILNQMACKAFFSWTRFYSTFPSKLKPIFNIRSAHTGHYAKSLALREAPGSKNMRRAAESSESKEKPKNRLTRERNTEEPKKERAHFCGGTIKLKTQKRGLSQQARQRELITSEYDSGLAPLKKKKF